MTQPGIYGFARALTRLEREALDAIRRRHHYDHPQPEGAHVNHLVDAILTDAANIGGDVHLAYQHALEKHLTLANMAAHVANEVAQLDANPLVGAVLNMSVGPAAGDTLARLLPGLAAELGHLDAQQTLDQVAPEPAPAA